MRNDREDDDADVTTVDVTHGHSCGNAEEEECRPTTFAMNHVGMNVVVHGMMVVVVVVVVVVAVYDATIDVMVMMMTT